MSDQSQTQRLQLLVEKVELPDTAYDAAKRRYEDLGEWFERDNCSVRDNDPHIFVQGSFALGTAIVPVKAGDEYDLDLTCKLRKRISRATHSQRQLKDLVGAELAAYREARHIDKPLEPKNRCWRLSYKDELPFHLDVVPSIPAEDSGRATLQLLMEQHGIARNLANDIAGGAVWITDRRSPTFRAISDKWPSSNPEGYVRWFLSRMRKPTPSLLMKEAQVDQVPEFLRKTPLQRAIQLLKTDRDIMFIDTPDVKPVSIIITTIAGNAYVPGESLLEAIMRILRALEAFRVSNSDEVLNPVNPHENFADKWHSPECRHLKLKEHFHAWIVQVNANVQQLLNAPTAPSLQTLAESRLGVRLSQQTIATALQLETATTTIASPRRVSIDAPAKPWAPE